MIFIDVRAQNALDNHLAFVETAGLTFQKGSKKAVTSDKLLSTMLIEKPKLQESNPDTPWAASLQFFGFKPEQDLTLGNLLKLDEPSLPTTMPPALEVPVNPNNQQNRLATDPGIIQATTEKETNELSVRSGPPRDDMSREQTREVECSQFKPANGITPAIDATKDVKT
ncbi:hypothetical protein DSO57_1031724 [Entomophthora muscae]|uniref:Uncharacterized protein n=1 Tax=Entomophthora muscae TaxID=34485 RepID=A0ACC2SD73_9FUNG|nr:hypothetical protein DSO57_1031724 [Entomophthora muscae]